MIFIIFKTNTYIFIFFFTFRTDANVSITLDQNNIVSSSSSKIASNILITTPIKTLHCKPINENLETIATEIPHRQCSVDNFPNNDNFDDAKLCVETDDNVPLTPKSTKRLHELSGRRVVEIFTFIREIQNTLFDHGPIGCSFNDMDLISETRSGLQSNINFKCKMCGLEKSIKTNNYENEVTININEAAVVGTLSSGGGYSHLSQIFSAIDIPVMSHKIYTKYENKVSTNFEKVAAKMMLNAAKEEKTLAIENNEVDNDGVPLLTVICDGSWGKRSYRTMYNSSSGTVSN